MKMLEAQGKTVNEAVENGLRELNMAKNLVDITVLDEGSKGFLGIGARPARVLLTEKLKSQIEAQRRQESDELKREAQQKREREQQERAERQARPQPPVAQDPPRKEPPKAAPMPNADVPKSEALRTEASRTEAQKTETPKTDTSKTERPKTEAPIVETPKTEAPKVEAPRAEMPKRQPAPRTEEPQPQSPRANRLEQRTPEQRPRSAESPRKPAPRPSRPAQQQGAPAARQRPQRFSEGKPLSAQEADTLCQEAKQYFSDIVSRMGVSVGVACQIDDNGLRVEASGPDAGTLIGYRGETLDALQYLVSLKINKGEEGYQRVTLDAESYRQKREETLVKLAHRLAHKAAKTGKKVTLEPMNPYERRILHSALQSNSNVRTHSEGEEPYRRVVISPKREQGRHSAAE